MKRYIFLTLILFGALFSLTAQFDEYQYILEELDETLSYEDDLSTVMTIVSEDPDQGTEKMKVSMFRRDAEDKFVMLIHEPAVQKGQGYLKLGDNMWFYDPESRKFNHTSLKESFSATDARNSDFRQATFVDDYRITDVEETTLGKFDVYALTLEGKHNEVTYAKRKIWVTKSDTLMLMSKDYSKSGRLMRTSYFPKYKKVEGEYYAAKMIFVDELVENKKTVITIEELSLDNIPDSVFTKAYVEKVNR